MSAGLSIARIEVISAYHNLTVLCSGRTELTLLLITVNVWPARLFFYWLQWTFDISSLLITVNVIGLSWSSLSIHSGSQTVVACYLISFRCFYEPDRISPLLTTDYSERLLSLASCPAIWSASLLITVNVTAVWVSAMTLLITVNVWLVQRQASARLYRVGFLYAVFFCTTTLNSSGVSHLIQNWLCWLQWTFRLINALSPIHFPLLYYCGSISTEYSECSADYSERCSHLNCVNCQARNNNVMNLTKTRGVT